MNTEQKVLVRYGKFPVDKYLSASCAILIGVVALAPHCACGKTMIAVPENATEVEMSAAAELQEGITRIVGERPEIVPEREANEGKEVFFVGSTAVAAAATNEAGITGWNYDGIFIKSVPEGVVLAGHPVRGAFYAVDEYLERFCGVRWWTSSEAHYPKLERLPMRGISLLYAPQFKYRETYYLDSFHALFKVRTKGNFSSLTRYMLDPMEFVPPELGGDHRMHCFPGRKSAYHSFFEILPPSKYFADHPEWYSMVKGERTPYQLCLSNLEMAAAFAEETRKILRDDPDVDFISISQNDETRTSSVPPCSCAACSVVTEEEGAHSGGVIRFVNRVAEALEAEFPEVRFDTFAYRWSRTAPKKAKPRRNVTVRYCDIECPFSFPLDTPGNKISESFMENLKAWSSIARGNLYIWDYVVNFRNYMIPHPNLRSLARNVRIFADAGAVGVFEQGDVLCPAGEFAALKYWLVSHLLWNPSLDEKILFDDFLNGYYGRSAAPKVAEYISIVNDSVFRERVPVRCYHYNVTNFMSEASVFAAERTMAAAVCAAAKDGVDCVRRVRREKLSIDQVFLLNWKEYRAWAAANGEAWPFGDDYPAAVDAWISAAKGFGVKAVHETVTRGTFDDFCGKLRRGVPDR